jgi:hypothetical protein
MTRLTRLSLRLIVPALALGAVIAAGEPLPSRTTLPLVVVQTEHATLTVLQQEAEALRLEAEATKKAASRTASQMRWFLTLPAAGSRRSSGSTGSAPSAS